MLSKIFFLFDSERGRTRFLTVCSLAVFLLLVGAGITGSSFGWLKNYPGSTDVMELLGERKLAGMYRGIRCDEFLNHGLPNALAQYHASERFPRFNRNLGISPRDFSVYHDSGIPVNHYATLARPAVWGFYFLDLRRALSWYWWFPVFAGLTGIWFLLNTLFPDDTFRNWLLSLSLTASPLCAAWSFWPLGNLAGLVFAAGILIRLVKSESAAARWMWAMLMTWCGLCSLMTLYVPRIFPVACLLLLAISAYLKENHLFSKLKSLSVLLPILAAACAAALFLTGWVYDASEAIQAILETAYPGRRRMSGGTMGLWTVMQGWLAPLTIYKVDYSNQCELQGPLSFLFPLAFLLIARFRDLKRSWFCWSIVVFSVWTYCYQLIGFPDWLASITFWNRCNPPRCSLALSLAQILFIALLSSRFRSGLPPEGQNRRRAFHIAAVSVLLFSLLLCYPGIRPLRTGLLPIYSPAYLSVWTAVILIAYGLLCWFLMTDLRKFVIGFVLVHLLPAVCFNPVCIAPARIVNRLEPVVQQFSDLQYGGRFLILGKQNFNAVAAFAAGAKVLNGYYLYPDRELHRMLFHNEPDPKRSFRLSNYDFVPVHGKGISVPMKIRDDGLEHIQILLDAEKFDFSILPADFAAAPLSEREYLDKNPALKRVRSGSALDYYRILRKTERCPGPL